MLNCREVTEKASDYLDRALSRRQRLSIRLHLFLCHHCRRYVRQLRAITMAMRQAPIPEFSEEAIDKQIKALRKHFSYLDNRNDYS